MQNVHIVSQGMENNGGGIVDLEKFKETIQSLFERNIADLNTTFHLYNWGGTFFASKI